MSHKIGRYTLIAIILVAQTAWSQTRPKADPRRDMALRGRTTPRREIQTDMAQQLVNAQSQARRLQAEHRELSEELKAIQALAKEEKAPKTLEKINELIETKNRLFAAQFKKLSERVQRIKAAQMSLEKRDQAQNRINTIAPAFSARTVTGETISSTQNKGKIVVLEWFNPECKFTRYAYQRGKIPELAQRYINHENVTWLGVCSTPSSRPSSLPSFMQTYKIQHPIIDDTSGQMAKLFYAKTTPQFMIIGKDGRIAYSGPFDNSLPKPKNGKVTGYVANALAEILQGKPVTIQTAPASGTPISTVRR